MFARPTEQRKDTEILIRISSDQKRQIKSYAKKHNLTVATAIRLILQETIDKEKKGE